MVNSTSPYAFFRATKEMHVEKLDSLKKKTQVKNMIEIKNETNFL